MTTPTGMHQYLRVSIHEPEPDQYIAADNGKVETDLESSVTHSVSEGRRPEES